jgi:lysozyme family protein
MNALRCIGSIPRLATGLEYTVEKIAAVAARWTDWSIGGLLTLLEEYNGLGYASMGRPSPYVWASTDQYHSGKYIADGHYDPNAIDHQLGCGALLARMAMADTSINLVALS